MNPLCFKFSIVKVQSTGNSHLVKCTVTKEGGRTLLFISQGERGHMAEGSRGKTFSRGKGLWMQQRLSRRVEFSLIQRME